MSGESPLDDRRYDQSEYERFWSAAAALSLPLSLHRRRGGNGKIRGAGDETLRDASSRATNGLYPAVDLRSDLLPRLRASSPPQGGHRRVRAGLGAPPALHDGLHLPRAPRRGSRTARCRAILPPQRRLEPFSAPGWASSQPSPRDAACLRRLHAQACRLAETNLKSWFTPKWP